MNSKKHINKSQRLFIELGTSLRLESGEPETHVSSELIGMKVGKYLIVRLSKDRPDTFHPNDNDPVKVRYLCSGEIFGFNSHVIMGLENPDRLLFLEYPETVVSVNVRSHERIECFIPVQVALGQTILQGLIININFQGCLCTISSAHGMNEPSLHEMLLVRVPLPDGTALAIPGEIRSIRVHSSEISLGICFEHLDSFARSILENLIPSLSL